LVLALVSVFRFFGFGFGSYDGFNCISHRSCLASSSGCCSISFLRPLPGPTPRRPIPRRTPSRSTLPPWQSGWPTRRLS
jgi:hypothetical protein